VEGYWNLTNKRSSEEKAPKNKRKQKLFPKVRNERVLKNDCVSLSKIEQALQDQQCKEKSIFSKGTRKTEIIVKLKQRGIWKRCMNSEKTWLGSGITSFLENSEERATQTRSKDDIKEQRVTQFVWENREKCLRGEKSKVGRNGMSMEKEQNEKLKRRDGN